MAWASTSRSLSIGSFEANLLICQELYLRTVSYMPPGRITVPSTTVASLLPAWSSPGRVWEGRSVDVCCSLVGLAGGMGTRTGSAQGADRTCVRPRRNTGDRRSLSRGLAVRGYAQDRLASGRAGRA